jgi:hypothetical protein
MIARLRAEAPDLADLAGISLDQAVARSKAKVEKKHEVAAAAFSSEGPFDVVVIVPPSPYDGYDGFSLSGRMRVCVRARARVRL